MHIIPYIITFPFFSSLHSYNFQFTKLLTFGWIFVFLLSAKLIITTLLVETEQYPRQFLFSYSLRECFLPQIIECPIKWNFLSISYQCRLMARKICYHLIKRVHEQETHTAVFLPLPCKFRLTVVKKLPISFSAIAVPTDCSIIVLW